MPRKKPKAEKEKPVVDALVIQDTVDNPLYHPIMRPEQPAAITLLRTFREDVLGQMFARKQLARGPDDKGADRLAAGRRFQADHEAAGGHLGSSGDLKDPVDGSPHYRDGITDRQLAGMKAHRRYREALGESGYRLCVAILIDKHTLRWAADNSGLMPGKATTTFTGHRFRECLDTLARLMKLAP